MLFLTDCTVDIVQKLMKMAVVKYVVDSAKSPVLTFQIIL